MKAGILVPISGCKAGLPNLAQAPGKAGLWLAIVPPNLPEFVSLDISRPDYS
ncbi:MAG TPA: hypothetical protein VH413_14750 [Verrucomicrobiae bacterium]|jgi:hypothetical protein|nr:hypothetical protein [Verrucomicrobiae bacterium]